MEDAENLVLQELRKYMPNPAVLEIYKMVITDVNKNQSNHLTNERRQILIQIETLNNKLNKARELLLSDDIDPVDYKLMKLKRKLQERKPS